MKASRVRVTSVEFEGDRGFTAIVARVDQDVPPVGVSWIVTRVHPSGVIEGGPVTYWTSRAAAEGQAKAWCAQ